MPNVVCARCGEEREQMPFRPFQNDIGLRVFEQICNACWQEWLTTQKQLMNDYALHPREPRSKQFLFANMVVFLFGKPGEKLPTL
jgi:Fe-S cluster biosynthesis and repair protein YggX